MNQEIINYIKENLAKGVAEDQIRQSLVARGWQQADIDAAFLQLEAPPSSLPPFPIKHPSAQNQPPKSAGQKSFLNPKILIGVAIIALLLAVGGGSYFFVFKEKPEYKRLPDFHSNNESNSDLKYESSTDSEKITDKELSEGILQNCLVDFTAMKEKLNLKKIANYKNVGTFHPSPEALDTSFDAPVRESGIVKDSLYARYYFIVGNYTDTILNVNVAEFENKVDLERTFNTLHDLQKTKDSRFINFYFKYIEGQIVYFVEQTLSSEQILPGGGTEKQESQRVDIYLQVSDRNIRVHFNLLGSSLNNRRISMEEAEMVFKDWIATVCNSQFELVIPNF